MNEDALVERIKTRYLDDEKKPKDAVIKEMITTIRDRLLIRLDSVELPETAGSLIVEASVKALRLRGFEGSTSESSSDGGSISNSFIDDVLSAYAEEINSLYRQVHRSQIKFINPRR
jgi:hypothetical protein